MALDKVVDSAQLDADLTAVADAIRDRAGTSEPLVFPDGFVGAVEGIPDYMAMRCTGTLTEYRNDTITTIVKCGFCAAYVLEKLYLPAVTRVNAQGIDDCPMLTTLEIPNVTYLGNSAVRGAVSLRMVSINAKVSLDYACFVNCSSLDALILRSNSLCDLNYTNAFNTTPIESGTGYVYVPRSLVDSYKSATNWSTYASQIRAIEDYPDITGG